MGYSFGVKCEKCNYTFEASVGHGMRGCGFFEIDPNTSRAYFCEYIRDKRIINDINLLLETKEGVLEDENTQINQKWYGHGSAQYICTKCGCLHNRFYFRLLYKGGVYEPDYYCKECSIKLKLIDIEGDKSKNCRCPICGHDELIRDEGAPEIHYD